MTTAMKVTVSDPESGEVLAEQVIDNDYVIVVAGSCYLAHTNAYGSGTHVLTVKGRTGLKSIAAGLEAEELRVPDDGARLTGELTGTITWALNEPTFVDLQRNGTPVAKGWLWYEKPGTPGALSAAQAETRDAIATGVAEVSRAQDERDAIAEKIAVAIEAECDQYDDLETVNVAVTVYMKSAAIARKVGAGA